MLTPFRTAPLGICLPAFPCSEQRATLIATQRLHRVLDNGTFYNNAETRFCFAHSKIDGTNTGDVHDMMICYWLDIEAQTAIDLMIDNVLAQSAPALGILVDLPLGVLMWAALLRFLLTIFMKENSRFLPMRLIVSFTSPIISAARPLTPIWVIDRIAALHTAVICHKY